MFELQKLLLKQIQTKNLIMKSYFTWIASQEALCFRLFSSTQMMIKSSLLWGFLSQRSSLSSDNLITASLILLPRKMNKVARESNSNPMFPSCILIKAMMILKNSLPRMIGAIGTLGISTITRSISALQSVT
jgi:hypothetical protein